MFPVSTGFQSNTYIFAAGFGKYECGRSTLIYRSNNRTGIAGCNIRTAIDRLDPPATFDTCFAGGRFALYIGNAQIAVVKEKYAHTKVPADTSAYAIPFGFCYGKAPAVHSSAETGFRTVFPDGFHDLVRAIVSTRVKT